jgi:hypothetical protein
VRATIAQRPHADAERAVAARPRRGCGPGWTSRPPTARNTSSICTRARSRAGVPAAMASRTPARVWNRRARPARRASPAAADPRPTRTRPVPRFRRALLDVLDTEAARPDRRRERGRRRRGAARPVRDTAWRLEEIAPTAADAAVQLHPGGRVGIPDNTA